MILIKVTQITVINMLLNVIITQFEHLIICLILEVGKGGNVLLLFERQRVARIETGWLYTNLGGV